MPYFDQIYDYAKRGDKAALENLLKNAQPPCNIDEVNESTGLTAAKTLANEYRSAISEGQTQNNAQYDKAIELLISLGADNPVDLEIKEYKCDYDSLMEEHELATAKFEEDSIKQFFLEIKDPRRIYSVLQKMQADMKKYNRKQDYDKYNNLVNWINSLGGLESFDPARVQVLQQKLAHAQTLQQKLAHSQALKQQLATLQAHKQARPQAQQQAQPADYAALRARADIERQKNIAQNHGCVAPNSMPVTTPAIQNSLPMQHSIQQLLPRRSVVQPRQMQATQVRSTPTSPLSTLCNAANETTSTKPPVVAHNRLSATSPLRTRNQQVPQEQNSNPNKQKKQVSRKRASENSVKQPSKRQKI